jgi:hypothetical protein
VGLSSLEDGRRRASRIGRRPRSFARLPRPDGPHRPPSLERRRRPRRPRASSPRRAGASALHCSRYAPEFRFNGRARRRRLHCRRRPASARSGETSGPLGRGRDVHARPATPTPARGRRVGGRPLARSLGTRHEGFRGTSEKLTHGLDPTLVPALESPGCHPTPTEPMWGAEGNIALRQSTGERRLP